MPASARTKHSASSDYRGNNIFNLGSGASAIPDLVQHLITIGTQVYGYVYGEPYQGNIAVVPFGTANTPLADTGAVKPFQNTFGSNFDQNTIGSGFTYNVFGNASASNRLGTDFSYNTAGSAFNLNRFASNTKRNVFGDNVNTVTKSGFGGPGIVGFSDNIVGDNVSNIYVGDNVTFCKIGNTCNNIEIGANCFNVNLINCHADANGARFVIPANSSNVTYNNNILEVDPYGVAGKLSKAANLSDLQDAVTARKNLGLTDDAGKVLTALLPSYVDDVLEFDTVALLPVVGERGKIYVITTGADIDKQYRWSGTAYRLINGSTSLPETVLTTNYAEQDAVSITHNKGRWVLVQIYEADGYGTEAEIQQVDLNTVTVRFGAPGTGKILIF